MTMVKRVAQALQQEMGTAPFDETAASFALARAAIAAMREPTEEMIDAWIRAPGAPLKVAGKPTYHASLLILGKVEPSQINSRLNGPNPLPSASSPQPSD